MFLIASFTPMDRVVESTPSGAIKVHRPRGVESAHPLPEKHKIS